MKNSNLANRLKPDCSTEDVKYVKTSSDPNLHETVINSNGSPTWTAAFKARTALWTDTANPVTIAGCGLVGC